MVKLRVKYDLIVGLKPYNRVHVAGLCGITKRTRTHATLQYSASNYPIPIIWLPYRRKWCNANMTSQVILCWKQC